MGLPLRRSRSENRVFTSPPDARWTDQLRYMRAAYDLFNAGDAASDVALEDVASLGPVDEFYSLLYRGLWREAAGDAARAREI